MLVLGILYCAVASAQPACSPDVTVAVDGTGGDTGTLEALQPGSVHVATPLQIWPLPTHTLTYNESVRQGTADTIAVLEQTRTACPDSHVTLTGYSQGARIAGDVLEARPDLADAGVLVSDPRRVGSGIETQLPGVPFMGADFQGEREPFVMPVTSQCIAGDPICDLNMSTPIDSALGYFEKHGSYIGEPVQQELIAADTSASILVQKQLDSTVPELAPAAQFITDQIMPVVNPVLSQLYYGQP